MHTIGGRLGMEIGKSSTRNIQMLLFLSTAIHSRNTFHEASTEKLLSLPAARDHSPFPICHMKHQRMFPVYLIELWQRTPQFTLLKSINPRSTLVLVNSTRSESPTSKPLYPLANRPSSGGFMMRTHVPLEAAPVTMASN